MFFSKSICNDSRLDILSSINQHKSDINTCPFQPVNAYLRLCLSALQIMKQNVERRRRERIQQCLDDIKSIVLKNMNKNVSVPPDIIHSMLNDCFNDGNR